MAKIIKLTDIEIKELAFSQDNKGYILSVVYAILDDTGKEFDAKRTTIKDFEKNDIKKIFQKVVKKLKILEGI